MSNIVIFGGTTEGRKLSEYLRGMRADIFVCTATEYGGELVREGENIHVHAGRMNRVEMEAFFQRVQAELVLDATHPFAAEVSENIKAACERTGTSRLRIVRRTESGEGGVIQVSSVAEAADYVSERAGRALITTGSKELIPYTRIPDYKSRCYLRALSTAAAVNAAVEAGFEGEHLIAMQGPYSEEMNLQLLRHVKADFLITKASGEQGGYEEKLRAAKRAGTAVIAIGAPKEEGCTLEEAFELLEKQWGFAGNTYRTVTLVGVGPGNPSFITEQGKTCIREADALAGAKRILEAAGDFGKTRLQAYTAEPVFEYLKAHPTCRNMAVLLSGDVSFYSGAKKLKERLEQLSAEQGQPLSVSLVPGVSSAAYLAAKLGERLENAALISMHGRNCNVVEHLRERGRVFLLAGTGEEIQKLFEKLCDVDYGYAKVHVGSRLSYADERIISGTAEELAAQQSPWEGLSVLFISLPGWKAGSRACGLGDEAFIRGNVPMTKREIRSLALSMMNSDTGDVLYDIGAGTGSVSIELARQAPWGTVYAVEKNPEGLELICANQKKFHISNIVRIKGHAPEALADLPAPDGAFVGGNDGELRDILDCLRAKNPAVRVVITAVTVETLSAVMDYMKQHPELEPEIVQIQSSRGRKAGGYHLMTGQNPVWLTAFGGEAK